jgi:8-oxo-dGTP diphosphatase
VLADFAARPARTVPLILLRHAKAQSKSGWKRSDAVRPLDDSGRSDAKALADLLACFAQRPRLISSPAVRCTDTLRPLSELTGEPVRTERSLYLHNESSLADVTDPAAELAALLREVIAEGEPTVVCAHRENLPLVQEAALAALTGHTVNSTGDGRGDGVPGDAIAQLPKEWDDTLPTSGFWVLNVAAPATAGEEADPAPAALPLPSDPVAPAPRRWWRRIFGVAPHAQPGSGDEVPAGELGGGDPRIPHTDPVGVLVSADRYDLAEP